MLTYLAIARRYRPEWVVWENVPGVLSSAGGRDFATFLRGLEECGYGIAYRVLDAQYFGLAQRRRRVFVVGCLGGWQRAAAVLFERHSLSGHPAPRRETREGVATTISARTRGGGGLGTDFDCDGGLIPSIANPLTARMHKGINTTCDEGQTMIAHSLRASGFDASEDGTGRGTPLVPVVFNAQAGGKQTTLGANTLGANTLGANTVQAVMTLSIRGRGDSHDLEVRQDGTANALLTPNGGRGGIGVGAVAFDTSQITSNTNRSNPQVGDPCHTLHQGATHYVASLAIRGRGDGRNMEVNDSGVSNALVTPNGGRDGMGPGAIISATQVRRLTPKECARLQGFPDDYLDITYRNKPAADGPRYKALGNSMAVPVMSWIGKRIAQVAAIKAA